MGTPKKPTTRGTTRRLKATQDSLALDLKATDLQASTNYKSKPHDPRMEADMKMNHCSGCKQKFNKTNTIAKFCPLTNICRMCSHSQKVTEMEGKMCSVLHSRDQLEEMNAQLQQQNKLLQEQVALLRQQVNQVQALQTPNTSLRGTGAEGCCAGEVLGIHLWPTLYLPGEHTAPLASTNPKHRTLQP